MLGGTRSAAALCAACLGDLPAVPQDAVVPVARWRGVFRLCSGCSGCSGGSGTLNYQGHKAYLVRRPRDISDHALGSRPRSAPGATSRTRLASAGRSPQRRRHRDLRPAGGLRSDSDR